MAKSRLSEAVALWCGKYSLTRKFADLAQFARDLLPLRHCSVYLDTYHGD